MKTQIYLKTRFYLCLAVALFGTFAATAATKVQVWDFGAELLDAQMYENMLSVDEINSWFPDVVPGTSGVQMSSWTASDSCNIRFDGGGKINHRYRTTNTALTRYDNKSLKDAAGNEYTGYIYSNSSSSSAIYLASTYEPNDKVEFWVGSNGGVATYEFASPGGKIQTGEFTNAAKAEKLTFYVSEAGEHKIYCINEKLVIARVLRYPAQPIVVSGTVTAPTGMPAGYQLQFTNQTTGWTATATPADGAYSVELAAGYDYTVSLIGANGYVVVEDLCSLTDGIESYTHNITITGVDLVTLSGNVSGLPAEQLAKVEFVFSKPDDKTYVPEIELDRVSGNFSLQLERGVEYGVAVLNVNDYNLDKTTLSATTDGTLDLPFTAKPVYTVTINPTGASLEDLAAATFIFTNLNEEGYVYTFIGPNAIALRDGVYSVKVENSGAFTQMLTSNLRVEGAAVTKTIDFTTGITSWNFKDMNNYDASSNVKNPCSGLAYTFATGGKFKYHGSSYGSQAANLTISVPVSGPGIIKVAVGYSWDITFNGEQHLQEPDGGNQTLSLSYSGAAGYADITVGGATTTYIASIEFVEVLPYAPTVTVGADKDYQTINDALAAIRKMERPNNESVTIMIDPGNYEEMLVIDMDSIRMVNASATPSIAIKNAGVDIDENAVRITSYYGHGYNYASMGSDYKWDARTLQVNKENGYASVVNGGGSGTTYWNATVVIEGKDFYAENIIFENSYNQYISAKEAADVVYEADGSKGARPVTAGSTEVQQRSYRERAAAFATAKTADRTFLNNCRVIGRQDSFYGAEGRVACYKGALMGACDYLFGEMNLACYQTDLVLNTADDKDDVAYITAPKTNAGARGMFFYECSVISAVPEVETASASASKPALWGRPWAANTAEAIFASCGVGTSTYNGVAGDYRGQSLIAAEGWSSGLSGESARCGEYDCNTSTAGRVAWATVFTEPRTADGVEMTLKNWTKGTDGWDPFADYGVDTDALPDLQHVTALPQSFFTAAGLEIVAGAGHIKVRGVEESTRVEVWGADGRLLAARTISADTEIRMPGQGVYIVRATTLSGQAATRKIGL